MNTEEELIFFPALNETASKIIKVLHPEVLHEFRKKEYGIQLLVYHAGDEPTMGVVLVESEYSQSAAIRLLKDFIGYYLSDKLVRDYIDKTNQYQTP